MKIILCCALVTGLAQVGCNEEEVRSPDPAPEDLNASVAQIPAGEVTSGFKHGRLRTTFDVERFSISKQPITRKQFRTCVESGVCRESTGGCANLDGAAKDVALCVGLTNAQAYCAWSGGRLPTLNEWLFAARGQSPQRFAWGDSAPSCQQHPLARVPMRERDPEHVLAADAERTECGERSKNVLRVGEHAAGASSHGLEDVLLAKGELLIGHPDSNFGTCRAEGRGCLVFGLIPGAIDSVKPLAADGAGVSSSADDKQPDYSAVGSAEHSYAFRCVWSQEEA